MISIIISSYQPDYLNALKENIRQTIGVPHEVIAIENHRQMGICQLYNIGARKARYDILCFAHEDILIHTRNWGNKVLELFEATPGIGLIGVAGGKYKSYVPSGWSFAFGNNRLQCMNYLQGYRDDRPSFHVYNNPDNKPLSQVASVDGLWFCTSKNILSHHPFDEKTFGGFHCYDIDFSLQVAKDYRNFVTYEILIEHFSAGNFDSQWLIETLKLHKKWGNRLPFDVSLLNKKILKAEELGSFNFISSNKQLSRSLKAPFYSYLLLNSIKLVRVLGLFNLIKAVLKVFKIKR